MRIIDHWLSAKNSFKVRSPNVGDYHSPDTIVLHYTAGGNAESAVSHLINPLTEVSAHLVVSRDLRIFQLTPFNRIAWHAGKSKWKGRESLNRYSIGVEIENAGKLDYLDGKFISWFGKEYQENEVISAKHQNSDKNEFWHLFDRKQLDLTLEICRLLIPTYNIKEIVGHDEIAPDRKIDPGPAFPMEEFKKLTILA